MELLFETHIVELLELGVLVTTLLLDPLPDVILDLIVVFQTITIRIHRIHSRPIHKVSRHGPFFVDPCLVEIVFLKESLDVIIENA